MKKTRFENIDEYNENPNKCKYCGKPIIATYNDKLANIKRKTFCNSSCAASYNNSHGQHRPQKGVSYCLNCGNVTKKINKFCSCKCSSDFQYKQYIKKWKNGEVNGLQKTNGIHTHLILGDIYLKNIIINVQDVDGEKK